ncbi:MAG: hypothetical protein V3T11_10030 [Roseateles sp.]
MATYRLYTMVRTMLTLEVELDHEPTQDEATAIAAGHDGQHRSHYNMGWSLTQTRGDIEFDPATDEVYEIEKVG